MDPAVLMTPRDLLDVYLSFDRELSMAAAGADTDIAAAITALAVRRVPGAEQASITDRRRGQFRTLAATGAMATAGDNIQYELGSGPCIDAVVDNAVFRTGDVAIDARWPRFGARAHTETGAVSMLAFRLFFEEEPERIAALNLYSTRPDAFDETAEIIGTVLAAHSASALLAAAARDRAVHLQRALASNRRIGVAVGVLMSSHKITDADAFALLRIASQNSNRKLVDVAEDVIETGQLELPLQPAERSARRPSPPVGQA